MDVRSSVRRPPGRFPERAAARLEGTVRDADRTIETSQQRYQVLFPVAVGTVFLVVLVVGALVG